MVSQDTTPFRKCALALTHYTHTLHSHTLFPLLSRNSFRDEERGADNRTVFSRTLLQHCSVHTAAWFGLTCQWAPPAWHRTTVSTGINRNHLVTCLGTTGATTTFDTTRGLHYVLVYARLARFSMDSPLAPGAAAATAAAAPGSANVMLYVGCCWYCMPLMV